MSDSENLIQQVGCMELAELRSLWGKRFGAPPSLKSLSIMRMMLAWRLQAERHDGLDSATRKAIARSGGAQPEGLDLGVGTRITRTWKGGRVEVIVEEDGFRWNGTTFRSLSAAATAIAGSRWNGPRFFGLRARS